MNRLISKLLLLGALSLYASAVSNDLRLVGKGVLSYFVWDVYEVSYLTSVDKKVELIKIKYLRDIDKSLSQKGWRESLKNYKDVDKQLKDLVESSVDVTEGDIISIYKINGDDVIIKKNEKVILEKKDDKKLYSLAHAPWIGEYPVDSDLKRDLLK
ncbi:chalcone isomerase family protein [Halobacteriovorax sp. DA5]|uniref:chalcone isomerase family protein n=1 Tax=Halobacteriovorax sp. DA5 TaxID=2067553 RepID=UPI000CD0704A|nr:chalcone isomerase family protein [Halobacteriovorax sp. DA5]POB13468.1 hypothetical protein C0Z22_09905 [Halobacteriovorax sp. DA5]